MLTRTYPKERPGFPRLTPVPTARTAGPPVQSCTAPSDCLESGAACVAGECRIPCNVATDCITRAATAS